MVKEGPPPGPVGFPLQEHLKGIMTGHADPTPPGMPQQMIEFGSPLGMRGAA